MEAADVAAWGVVLLLLVGGLAFAVGGTVDVLRQAETVRSAEQTQGTVTSFFTRRTARADPGDLAGDQYGGGAAGAAGDDSYVIRIQYQYTVDGTTYGSRQLKARYATDTVVSNWFSLTDPKRIKVSKRRQTWEFGRRFREGESVTVYYDPDNPASSYLLKWYSIWPYVIALAGLFLLSVVPLPMVIGGVIGWVENRVEPDDPAVADGETPGVDVPVLSSLDLTPAGVERFVAVVLWGGLAAVLLWYPVHFLSATGDHLGVAILGVLSALTLFVCYRAASAFRASGSESESDSDGDPGSEAVGDSGSEADANS